MARMNHNRPQYNKPSVDYNKITPREKAYHDTIRQPSQALKGVDSQKGEKIKMLTKNKSEVYMIKQSEYKGHEFMDVRIHYKQDDEWLPGKKGITIPNDKVDDIIALMRQVQEERG